MKSLALPPRPNTRGAALIAVLALIVLITALITVFLMRTSFERSASASYDAAANTRLLADTVVNLVEGTINQATSGSSGQAWASQPGAIRTFDNQGALSQIFRLYSSTEIATPTTSGNLLADDIPPANWAAQPGLWVDLNQPVTVSGLNGAGSDQLAFPILDPRDPTDPGSVTAPKVTTKVDGFSINQAPGATAQQPAPMPVRWLYVLRNGQIVAPVAGASGSVTVAGASSDNPITGRIAYWTDDETAKVNLDTAAGSRSVRGGSVQGAPWDLPRFNLYTERVLFADNQPVQGEYQRYPGHPATTDLSSLFTALNLPMGNYPAQQTAAGTPSSFFDLLPRYNDNYGSKAGTANTTTSNVQIPVSVKTERLYTSPGELLFTPARALRGISRQQMESGKFFLTTHSRAPETTLFGTPRIAIWPIDSDYAANPSASNPTKLASTFDKLIAFCATTGPNSAANPYFFQRHDSTSPTNDWTNIPRNQALYGYLQHLTAQDIPGFGGNFLAKYSYPEERNQILTEIVDYVRSTNLYDHAIKDADPNNPAPRFTPRGNNPTTGWGQVVPLKIGNTRGLGRMYTLSEIGLLVVCTADGNGKQPSENGSANDWRSVSNLPQPTALKDASGAAVNYNYWNPTLSDTYSASPQSGATALNPGQKRLQAMLLLEVSSPMLGFDSMMPDFQVQISNLSNLSIDGKHPFPSGDLLTESMGTRLNYIQQVGGLNGFQYFISRLNWGNNTRESGWSNSAAPPSSVPYRFVSIPFTVSPGAANEMTIGGGVFQIQIRVKKKGTSTREVVQTFNVTFPSTTVPVPDLMKYGLSVSSGSANRASDWWGFDKRISGVGSFPYDPLASNNLDRGSVIRTDPGTPPAGTWTLDSTAAVPLTVFKNPDGSQPTASSLPASDVVRTLVPFAGDVRLLMAKETVDASGTASADMIKHAGYDASAYKLAHSFMQAARSNAVPGVDLGGKLVPGVTYDVNWAPKVPSNLTPGADWDWDTGLPGARDGAYANKPDEGNIYTSGGTSPYFNGESQENNPANSNLPTYFTANRILPSAVMFGSLPTGVKQGIPWRTLLFRPQASRPRDASGPKDHLLLDLFSMPVVEPYAISEPFSTAGKVNLNYQIVPFTYLNRDTGVRAVLASELVARVPKAAALRNAATQRPYYKIEYGSRPGSGDSNQPPSGPTVARLPLNLSDTDGTLRQFKEKFAAWDIFRSASEICDVYLVPQGYSWTSNAQADAAWYGDDFALVGDNVRERPYANIYPRVTTKSNTFTVHYMVQTLKNPLGQNPDVWTETRGVITGELRGSATLERFLDPAAQNIPDYATQTSAPSLDTLYQWRVIANSTFAP